MIVFNFSIPHTSGLTLFLIRRLFEFIFTTDWVHDYDWPVIVCFSLNRDQLRNNISGVNVFACNSFNEKGVYFFNWNTAHLRGDTLKNYTPPNVIRPQILKPFWLSLALKLAFNPELKIFLLLIVV